MWNHNKWCNIWRSILPAVTVASVFSQTFGWNTLQIGLAYGGSLTIGSFLGETAGGWVIDAIIVGIILIFFEYSWILSVPYCFHLILGSSAPPFGWECTNWSSIEGSLDRKHSCYGLCSFPPDIRTVPSLELTIHLFKTGWTSHLWLWYSVWCGMARSHCRHGNRLFWCTVHHNCHVCLPILSWSYPRYILSACYQVHI